MRPTTTILSCSSGSRDRKAAQREDRDFENRAAAQTRDKAEKLEDAAARHSTFLIQLCGSAARPYWMSISVLRSPIATGPAAPPLMRKSPLAEHTLPIGEMTAAVPQAKASFSFPDAASVRHWSMV